MSRATKQYHDTEPAEQLKLLSRGIAISSCEKGGEKKHEFRYYLW
jgi:hypothetical protein